MNSESLKEEVDELDSRVLTNNACPYIKYRVKKEVLNEISLYGEEYLQNGVQKAKIIL